MMFRSAACYRARVALPRCVAASALLSRTTPAAVSTAQLLSQRRWCTTSAPPSPPAKTIHVSDQDLALGNDMPPLLQYNEELVAAALNLVEHANSSQMGDGVDPVVEAAIANVMAMLFHEEYVPLSDQFAAIRSLALLPDIRKRPDLLAASHQILLALVPEPVGNLLIAVDLDAEGYSEEQVGEINHFALIILQGHENDDEFVGALRSLQARMPQLDQSTPFILLMQSMNDVLLQSRLAHLLTEACRLFDPESTGKIKLAELEGALGKILPKPAVAKMMGHVEADDNGQVPYAQMTRILLRGKEVEIKGEA